MKKPTLTAIGGLDVRPRADAEEFYQALEIDVLARTLWGEARSEGHIGMEAVASVVLNRVKVAQGHGGKYWWGSNIIQVCQKPYQFSCWNRSDPNFQKLQAVDNKNLYFATALRIARRAVIGALPDHTGGATHYHTDYASPYWARGQEPSAVIGRHIFYKLIKT
ncbi:MAG: cell wall hydrolase [Rhodospirillales bacterium]|nr:cell wall hydrolase [Alphaproteobacteria bacterium]MCB9981568.1 cell wall hydrolase [Rhodospirillales bacterium]